MYFTLREDNSDIDTNDEYPVIVIGASAGGFEALKKLVSRLPHDFKPPVFIVWHMAPDIPGLLPQVLERLNTIYVSHAYDGEIIATNRIYVAPPDRHMLIEERKIRVTRGPKENRFRPAVDPLFRSAAYTFGSRVVGIILSGALDDGTSGLWTIKHFGGITVVQDPRDAEVKGMPESAIREVEIDYCLPVEEISTLLVELSSKKFKERKMAISDEKLKTEIKVAIEENAFENHVMKFGELTPFTCPDCHGVLTEMIDGNFKRYRCHTGHAFSTDSLLDALTENVEESLYSAIRGAEESIILLNHMGDHFADHNQTKLAALYFQKANEASERSKLMLQAVHKHERLSNESMKNQMIDAENAKQR